MAVESWEGLRPRCLLSQMGVCGEGQVAFMPRPRTGSCTTWRTNPWARTGSISKLTLPLGERPRRSLIELYPPCSWSAWVSVCFCIADVFWPSVAESRIPVGDLRENMTQSDNQRDTKWPRKWQDSEFWPPQVGVAPQINPLLLDFWFVFKES